MSGGNMNTPENTEQNLFSEINEPIEDLLPIEGNFEDSQTVEGSFNSIAKLQELMARYTSGFKKTKAFYTKKQKCKSERKRERVRKMEQRRKREGR